MANINVYSSEFLIISIRNIHYLILRESELGIKEKAHSMGWLCRESEELRNNRTGLTSASSAASRLAQPTKPPTTQGAPAARSHTVGDRHIPCCCGQLGVGCRLTWLAKRRDILVPSLLFLVMWRRSCSMGVMPGKQRAGQLAPIPSAPVSGL